MAKSPAASDILAVARDADAILVTYAKLPGDLLRQLTRCKAIGRFGLGVDNIDLPAAKELGIAVNYVPDYCLREVSDHAMALLLALARKVPFSNKLAAEEWRSLRLAIKQETVAANIARAMLAFDEAPAALLLAGGGALDDELLRTVGESLRSIPVAVGRANIDGVHGPRFAVASGLVHLYAKGPRAKPGTTSSSRNASG